MRNETELSIDIDTAKQAASIVKHPLFIASICTLRDLTIEKFESLGFDKTIEMQECNLRLNLIAEFENNLVTMIQHGHAAFKALEDIQTFNKEMNNERN